MTATIPVGNNPNAVAVNATTNTVYVTNLGGNSVSVLTPVTKPDAPTGITATAGNDQATVAFIAPSDDGGSPITGYTVTATTTSPSGVSGQTATGTGSPLTVTGLTNGTSYTFTVTATNSAGTSVASAASTPVTPSAPTAVPDAPTGITATAGDSQATVTFTAPASNGGAPITEYTVTATTTTTSTSRASGQTATGTGSPITVTGLTNGTSYTFTVTATNSAGTSVASAASSAVTPVAAAVMPTPTPMPTPAVTPSVRPTATSAADTALAATGSDQELPLGLAALLLTTGLVVLGAARSHSRRGKAHIG